MGEFQTNVLIAGFLGFVLWLTLLPYWMLAVLVTDLPVVGFLQIGLVLGILFDWALCRPTPEFRDWYRRNIVDDAPYSEI